MSPLLTAIHRPSEAPKSASTRIAFDGSCGSRRKKTWVTPSFTTAERGIASAGPSVDSVWISRNAETPGLVQVRRSSDVARSVTVR